MKFTAALLAAVAACVASPLAAQALPTAPTAALDAAAPDATPPAATVDADPALWVVRDDDTTVYLFGTVHLLKPGLSWFDEAVKTAFDASGTVVMELADVNPDPATIQPLMIAKAIDRTGPPLLEKLPADKREAVREALNASGLPEAAWQRFDPWFAGLQLSVLSMTQSGYDPESGVERAVASAAEAAGKSVEGLETFEQQIGYLDGLSAEAQAEFLTSTVDELGKTDTMFGEMIANWAAGNPEKLAELMNEALRESPEVARVMLTERNSRWAGWIAERMQRPGTVFMAVGAGHLAGTGSVQDALVQRGLSAQRIAY